MATDLKSSDAQVDTRVFLKKELGFCITKVDFVYL